MTTQILESPRTRRTIFTLPLLVLTAIYFFDEFDTAAFGVLAPNIEKSFHISDSTFSLLVVGNLTILLLLVIPLSHYADRLPRRTFAVVLGLFAGVFSFCTGIAGSALLMFFIRLGNGIGVASNTTVHNSLLADYYDRERRGRVYAVHQSAIYAGSIIGPAFAGSVFSLTGTWRAAFMVAGAAACVMALFGLRLPEPVRGATDDLDAALAASEEEPISLREAARTLLAVPTLKRQYAATVFIGAGIVPLAFLVPFYFQRVYHVHPFGVGLIQLRGGVGLLFVFLAYFSRRADDNALR